MEILTKNAEKNDNYFCEKCNFICSKQSNFNKHLQTKKHNTYVNTYINLAKPIMHYCVCGNSYKHRQSLYTHKKTCMESNSSEQNKEPSYVPQSQQVDVSLVIELLKQNQEFKELMIEQTKQLSDQQQQNYKLLEQQQNQQQQQNYKLLEAVKDGKFGNTINNTTNNKFNLNFFLNETCKDAITMSDFINSIEVTMDDFIQTGNIGFVDGISKVMVERIKVMDLHTRPMHCTDLKRETLYIKNDEKWEKEDSDKTMLRRAVKNIANKNYNQLNKWYNNRKPEVEIIGSEDCENYFKYYKAALGGYDKAEDKKFEEKIIKNVLKEVLLEKVPT
jgi:hypothetical protein